MVTPIQNNSVQQTRRPVRVPPPPPPPKKPDAPSSDQTSSAPTKASAEESRGAREAASGREEQRKQDVMAPKTPAAGTPVPERGLANPESPTTATQNASDPSAPTSTPSSELSQARANPNVPSQTAPAASSAPAARNLSTAARNAAPLSAAPPAPTSEVAPPKTEAPARAEKNESTLSAADDPKNSTVDMRKPITSKVIKGAIDGIANEPGEKGNLNFRVEADARVSGAVTAGGWADLNFSVEKTDTGAVTLGADWEAAAKVGFDVGFASGEVAVGMGGSKKLRFKSSEDASQWMTSQLKNINDKARGSLMDVPQSRFPHNAPTVISGTKAFAQIKGELGISDNVKLEGRARREVQFQKFSKNGQSVSGRNDVTTAEGSLSAKVGGVDIKGSYSFSQNTQTGDPTAENNGTYRNHKVEFEISKEQLDKIDLKDHKSFEVFSEALAKANGGIAAGGDLQKQAKMLRDTLQRIKDDPGGSYAKGSIKLTYEANNVLENGSYKNQYQRLFVEGSAGVGRKFNTGVVKGEASATMSKSERIYQKLGTETESYGNQQFMNNDWSTWNKFKSDNPDFMKKLVDQRAENDPNGAVARARGQDPSSTNYNEATKALERDWMATGNNKRKTDAATQKLGRQIARKGNEWVVSSSEEKKIIDQIRSTSRRGGIEQVSRLFDSIESNGWSMDQMAGRFNGSNYTTLKSWQNAVKNHRSRQ